MRAVPIMHALSEKKSGPFTYQVYRRARVRLSVVELVSGCDAVPQPVPCRPIRPRDARACPLAGTPGQSLAALSARTTSGDGAPSPIRPEPEQRTHPGPG